MKEIGKVISKHPYTLRLVSRGSELCTRDDVKTLGDARFLPSDVVHVQVRQQVSGQSAPVQGGSAYGLWDDGDSDPHHILSREYFDKLFELLDAPSEIASQVCSSLLIRMNILEQQKSSILSRIRSSTQMLANVYRFSTGFDESLYSPHISPPFRFGIC